MKHFKLLIVLTLIFGLITLNASTMDDLGLLIKNKKVSIYGVKSEDTNISNGVGLFYNTQKVKLKVEGSETAFKTGAILQVNPLQTPLYVNIGANYINQDSSISNDVNQYSSAVAIGYTLHNDLYLEVGENISRLNSSQTSQNSPINSSIRKDTYMQIGKRFETPMGTIDTHINSNMIYKTLAVKEENYESKMNYYLNDAIKVGYSYSLSQDQICNVYSLNLSYFSTEYMKNISLDSYNVTLAIKANFTDITNFSTYKPLNKVKKHLARAQKFDNLVLHNNMNLRK